MEININEHAYNRMKERLGWNKKTANRMALKAYNEGISHNETTGQLFGFIGSKCLKHKHKGSAIRIYGEVVYCFVKHPEQIDLITVYQIPKNLKNQILNFKK